jgi:uncharacterized membrane protein
MRKLFRCVTLRLYGGFVYYLIELAWRNYSALPLNLAGQICALFALLWVPLSAFAILLDDWIRYWTFDEERPHYKLL